MLTANGANTASPIDHAVPPFYSSASLSRLIAHDGCMMAEFDLNRLEQQVDELIRLCDRLREENASLRASQEHLVGERAELIEKTELARSKVEAMVARLKSMEEQL